MVQFKDTFTGKEQRPYKRATSVQKCLRVSGKHNDLENVGRTPRHHTFFEMLGNFSFGDYFKRDAINYAWEFLTVTLKLPPERLWVTVFEEDDEAADIWLKEVKIDPQRFSRIGAKDNFWAMGDTGPCGPCSEIFYDHGPEVFGGPPGTPDEEGDRYVEIWNLVFMQYNRDAEGKLNPLPSPSVDTGMGLERLAAVMQGVHSNYDIDLFQTLIKRAAELTGCKDPAHTSLKVIADHIRSCSFLITDGVMPGNEGRGYVLRRIIRRAARHGYELGVREPFFYKLVATLCDEMGEAFPELPAARAQVERVLRQEEERFAETLEQGMRILDASLTELAKAGSTELAGETVFKLYDTYGFPVDLTADIAKAHDVTLDMAGYEQAMEAQRARARAASQFGAEYGTSVDVQGSSEFTGYGNTEDEGEVIALFRDGEAVDVLGEGEGGMVVLDRTPFYAESGGQAGDRGTLTGDGGAYQVTDTQKQGQAAIGHFGQVTLGTLKIGDRLRARVDEERRRDTAYNHSATHLMHAALRAVLGDHVTQKGSLVEADRLRFDFSHFEPVSAAQLGIIEDLVNDHIRRNHAVETRVMALDDAMEAGAMALFGEKYDAEVRVLRMGEFSVELCGGTHVARTGDIGLFKITGESGIAAGVRRIEAVTGEGALRWMAAGETVLAHIASMVKGGRDDAEEKVKALLERNRQLEKELEQLKGKLASSQGSDLASQAIDIEGTRVLAVCLEGADAKTLRTTLDQLKSKLGTAAVVLAAVEGDKVSVIAGVTKDRTDRIRAGDLVNMVAEQVGGRGGGRPDMAQAGGKQPENLEAALASVPDWVKARLAS
ncbi:MAG: alanine--tRNA ligase, partial [Pseudomonadota bacterium]